MRSRAALKTILLAVAVTGLGGSTGLAVPIVGLWNTGVDHNGNPNAVGVTESHYAVSTGSPIGSGYSFTTVNAATPHWVGNPTDARWIGPSRTANESSMLSDPVGTYFYDLVFSLDSFSSASISGQWASDNYGRLRLNGTEVASLGMEQFGSLSSFSITDSNLFLSGFNLLQFEVRNAPGGIPTGNPSGLLVSGLSGSYEPSLSTTQAPSNVPEGGSTAFLFASGLVGLALLRRRRK